jgi:hypothetical protein
MNFPNGFLVVLYVFYQYFILFCTNIRFIICCVIKGRPPLKAYFRCTMHSFVAYASCIV